MPKPRLWTVTIPRWHPTRLNDLIGPSKYKRWRLKTQDRDMLWAYCRGDAMVPEATGKRRVSITIVLGKGQRGGDPDCYFKSTGDGLKRCKLLVDDNRQGVEWAPVQFERAAEPATILTLEDIQ